MKKIISTLLILFILSIAGQALAFTDTNQREIQHLVDLGIINGFEDGTFRPKEEITRSNSQY